jgi:hypothetical protein
VYRNGPSCQAGSSVESGENSENASIGVQRLPGGTLTNELEPEHRD